MHAPIPRNFNPAHSPIQFDPITASIIIGGSLLTAGATGAAIGSSAARAKKGSSAASDAVAKEAEQKALMAQQEADKTGAARRALLDQSTSGFGPNKNLARSFLTTL